MQRRSSLTGQNNVLTEHSSSDGAKDLMCSMPLSIMRASRVIQEEVAAEQDTQKSKIDDDMCIGESESEMRAP